MEIYYLMKMFFEDIKLSDLKYIKRYIKAPKYADYIFAMICLLGCMTFFISIIIFGNNSSSFDVFYDRVGNIIYDFPATIGFSAKNDPYNCEIFTGVWDKAYPPMGYVISKHFAKLVDIDYYYKKNGFSSMAFEPKIMLVYLLRTLFGVIMLFELIRDNINGGKVRKAFFAFVLTFSLPVMYTVERGNNILFASVSLIIFIFFYDSKNLFVKEIALLSLAFSFSLKLVPAAFGFLLILNKKYKEAVRATVYGLLMLFIPFLFLDGGFSNVALFFRNLSLHLEHFGSAGDCGLQECLIHCGFNHLSKLCNGSLRYMLSIYLLICCFFLKRKWEIITAVNLVILIVPAHSFLYVLIYMLPSAICFINETEYRKADWFALFALIEIFLLSHEVFSFINILHFDYHYGILVLLIIILVYGTQGILNALSRCNPELPAFLERIEVLWLSAKKIINKKKFTAIITICISVLLISFIVLCSVNKGLRDIMCAKAYSAFFGDIIPYTLEFRQFISILVFIAVVITVLYSIIIPIIKYKEGILGHSEVNETESYQIQKQMNNTKILTLYKLARLLILISLLCILLIISNNILSQPDFPKEICRRCGVEQFDRGNYMEALDYFNSVPGYSDCDKYKDLCTEFMENAK